MERYDAGERYDVLFLDILMPDINGIDLAKKIRAFDPDVILIFLTSCLKYAPSGYEVKAFCYLLKPVDDTEFDRQIYYMASPSQIHQALLTELLVSIRNYLRKKGGECQVFPAPFDVKLSTPFRTKSRSITCSSAKNAQILIFL